MERSLGFLHIVYFWMNEGTTEQDTQQVVDACYRHLAKIPSVLHLTAGVPAGTPRTVVDNTYGVALQVEFADTAGHDLYQSHPDHDAFIAECKQFWARVQVYDTLIQPAP